MRFGWATATGDSDRVVFIRHQSIQLTPCALRNRTGFLFAVACEGRRRYCEPGGRLAQLVERFVYTEDVGSSSLSLPTTSQLNEAPARPDGKGGLAFDMQPRNVCLWLRWFPLPHVARRQARIVNHQNLEQEKLVYDSLTPRTINVLLRLIAIGINLP